MLLDMDIEIQQYSVIILYMIKNTMKDKKICIYINAYVANNLGDDMFIYSLCNHYPMISFYLQSSPQYSNTFYKIKNLTILPNYQKFTIENLLDIIDFQVFIGGSLFMEPNSINEIDMKFNNLVNRRLSSKIPCFIIGANFGEYTQRKFFELHFQWFKSMEGICFRDIQSYRLFSKLDNIIWAPDLIFSYKTPYINTKNNNIVISPIYRTERSGLPDFSNNKYFDFLAIVATMYLKMGFNITLAAFCIAQLDDVACSEIFARIPSAYREKIKIICYKNDIEIFLNTFLNAKYIIGTRFHSIILALKNRIPVFPIIYNIKTKNIIECYLFSGKYIDILSLTDSDFEFIDSNRRENYAPDVSIFEKTSCLHYHFLNEAIINKLGEQK